MSARTRRAVRIVAGIVVAAGLAVAGAELAFALGSPTASFTFTPPDPVAGQTVSFTNASAVDSGFPGDTLQNAWDFGDDSGTSTDPNPVHAYSTPGIYTVTLAADEFTFTTPNGSATTTAAVTVAPVTPPGNDNWAGAFEVFGDYGSTSGRNLGASVEPGEPTSLVQAETDAGKTVWWKWVAPRTARFMVDTSGSDFDTTLGIFTGSSVASLTEVVSNDDGGPGAELGTSLASFDAVAGTTYYVQVGGYDNHDTAIPDGTIQLFWAVDNDAFATALALESDNGTIAATNQRATLESFPVPEPNPFDTSLDNTVWYSWTPTVSGTASFTESGDFGAALGVYTGSGLGSLSVVGDVSGFSLEVGFAAVADTTYWIQVGTSSDDPGPFTLGWALTPPPGSLSGLVLAADGSPAPGVVVRACRAAVCTDRTSGARGAFSFLGLTPGSYVVRALPSDLTLLAAQTAADVTPTEATSGVLLRLATSGLASAADGPKSFRVNGCVGGSLSYVVKGDGVTLGSGVVGDGAGSSPVDGVYAIDLSSVTIGHPSVIEIDSTISCLNDSVQTQTALLFTDPSGTVVDDAAGGALLAGATVTLLDSSGNAIPSGDPRLSSSTSINPETSDAHGAWAWDVAPGTYRVNAAKTGCGSTTSGSLTVTAGNPATGVVLHLSCSTPAVVTSGTPTPTPPVFTPPPPATPPPSGLPNPAKDSANVIPISGTVLVNGIPLPIAKQIPFGATVDVRAGIVAVTTLGPNGELQTAYLYGGVFQLLLAPDGVTEFLLVKGDFSVCGTNTTQKRHLHSARIALAKAKAKTSKTVVNALWGTGKGRFRTTGRYSSATVRGTLWYVADRCDGTYTQVNQGVVTVLDLGHKRTLTVRSGHSVLVRNG